MKVNVYYGGRGLLEDPTLFVVDRIIQVLQELRVEVTRYNMYEDKSGIATLPNTLKECDGVILAASLEWFGIGGYMQQFLDMCWLYADKEKLATLYMMPVVVATAYGEQDAELSLRKAWDVLGGEEENPEPPSVYEDDIVEGFYMNFHPETGFAASYVVIIPDMGKNLIIRVGQNLQCAYGMEEDADVKLKASSTMIRAILAGKNTFQKGFMSGEITAKGNFKTLRMLDQIFHV